MEFNFSNRMTGLKPSAIREIFKSLTDRSLISFAGGNPNPLSFPAKEFSEIAEELLRDPDCLQYGITEGYPPLIETVSERCRRKFSVGGDGDSTMIVTGGQQGIDLCARVLLNEGDAVLCEEPSFIGALNSFRSYGARPVGIPMEDDGIDVGAFEKLLNTEKNVKLVYLIPTFQNPTGITMSVEKRRAVAELSARRGVTVLEDDPYGELRFGGNAVPTVKSMEKAGNVLYCSSFSKLLSPGIRLGYVVGPKPLVEKMALAKQSADVHTNLFFQILCNVYVTKYGFEEHIKDICDLYRKKCGLMISSLDRICGDRFSHTSPEGGLFIWCRLPDRIDGGDFAKLCLEHKLAVVPGQTFSCRPETHNSGFRINYSMPSDEDIVRGTEILARVFDTIK